MIATMVSVDVFRGMNDRARDGALRRARAGMVQFRAVLSFVLVLALLVPVVAQQAVPGADLVVARPVIDMYRNASTESDVVSQALYGTDVLSLKKQDGWYNIRTADGYTGWVQAADLQELHAAPYAPESNAVRVVALSANVYREPDVTRHAPLLQLPWEARLETKVDTQAGAQTPSQPNFDPNRWLQVRLVDGQTGWVQRGDISASFTPLSIGDMLTLARRFLGITYTWGGVSSFGFDCSGFTQMLERQRGIEMPRDAGIQAAWSGVVPVNREDLQPGDLLFFGGSASHITHTGMYIGDGQFIHDTVHDHPGVQISKLDDTPWTKLLVAARRIK
jgi:gamma-D-glutamyl-L-lysine dipeptidyl-peptidase